MVSKIISFELTMPNKGSWNGKWSGEKKAFFLIKKLKEESTHFMKGESTQSFHHNFGDGWSAKVKAEIIDSKEAKVRKKASEGFSGYDWMVDEIIQFGKIKTRQERMQDEKLNQ